MMDKTININLGGTLFQIDQDAFLILRDYLQSVNNRFRNIQGGLETIEDIELRIAEIFQSQKGLAGVISKENVEAMISIIGKPEDFDINEGEAVPPVNTSHRKRLYRNPDDTIISGVCGGLGAYLNTDPVLFRILFAISALIFGSGFFVYIVLWIAVPLADSESRKREMYGNAYLASGKHIVRRKVETNLPGSGDNFSSGVESALSEILNVIARAFYILLRIFLIITGVIFTLTGFLSILTFIMVFIFKYPGAFSTDEFDISLIYFPDFLNYIVSPGIAPWIIILTVIALVLPMLALIYWGIKMIFWFKARDGVVSLVCLVLWVLSITTLAIMLFNEGISFAETARSSSEIYFRHTPDTLYVMTSNKLSDRNVDKELSIKEEGYSVYINEEEKELYIRPYFNINSSDGDDARVEVRKRSSGRSELDALRKTEGLLYNYRISGDTLFLDEYFTIKGERKWAADNVGINLYVPEGTILKLDRGIGNLFHDRYFNRYDNNFGSSRWESGTRSFILTEDGLSNLNKNPIRR